MIKVNLMAAYRTLGGTEVQVLMDQEGEEPNWVCLGCGTNSYGPHRISLTAAKTGGNEHAGTCRALPLA